MELPISPRSAEAMIADNTIVKVLAGSHAYGMALPTSDIDHRGIFVADRINIQTPFFPIGESINMNGEDTVIYELSKFMHLYTQGNPNILEILWVDLEDVLHSTMEYEILRTYREELLSSKIAFTFTGYAAAQIKRIRGHNKWISNPKPVDPPRQIDYVSLVHNFTPDKVFKINLEDYKLHYRLIPYDGNVIGLYEFDSYETYDEKFTLNLAYDKADKELYLKPNGTRRLPLFILKFNKDEYNTALDDWKNYWNWKDNRNEKRSALEEEHGYDTKHGAHCVRLMRMGLEALQTGQINVKRKDAAELLAIRNGAWAYEEMVEYAEHLDNEIRNVWYHKTALPKTPDIKKAARIVMTLQNSIWDRT